MQSKYLPYRLGRRSTRLLSLILVLIQINVYAIQQAEPAYCTKQFQQRNDQALSKLYQNIPKNLTNMHDRTRYFAQLFLGYPYRLTALGEGLQGHYDQAPLYRVDAYDCQTYVETMLALTNSRSKKQFIHCIQSIRYDGHPINYTNRHHFVSPDWNRANQQHGFIKDITHSIHDNQGRSVAAKATALIDIPNWYRYFDQSKIRLCPLANSAEIERRLALLKKEGQTVHSTTAVIDYLPFSILFNAQGQANINILEQIPSPVVIEIVRPNWDLTNVIGTHLNVSHLGIAIREGHVLYFYQASSSQGKVIKSPLVDYLRTLQTSPTIRGINIQRILPTTYCQH